MTSRPQHSSFWPFRASRLACVHPWQSDEGSGCYDVAHQATQAPRVPLLDSVYQSDGLEQLCGAPHGKWTRAHVFHNIYLRATLAPHDDGKSSRLQGGLYQSISDRVSQKDRHLRNGNVYDVRRDCLLQHRCNLRALLTHHHKGSECVHRRSTRKQEVYPDLPPSRRIRCHIHYRIHRRKMASHGQYRCPIRSGPRTLQTPAS